MRVTFILLISIMLFSCKNTQRDDVWKEYEWLPADAEYSNPYLIPPDATRGYTPPVYGGQPVYDNDSTYVPPRGYNPY